MITPNHFSTPSRSAKPHFSRMCSLIYWWNTAIAVSTTVPNPVRMKLDRRKIPKTHFVLGHGYSPCSSLPCVLSPWSPYTASLFFHIRYSKFLFLICSVCILTAALCLIVAKRSWWQGHYYLVVILVAKVQADWRDYGNICQQVWDVSVWSL